jgi:hypothetical protein
MIAQSAAANAMLSRPSDQRREGLLWLLSQSGVLMFRDFIQG